MIPAYTKQAGKVQESCYWIWEPVGKKYLFEHLIRMSQQPSTLWTKYLIKNSFHFCEQWTSFETVKIKIS